MNGDRPARWTPPPAERAATRRLVLDRLRSDGAAIAVVVAAVTVSAAATALGPVVIRSGIDDGIAAGDRAVLSRAAVGFLVLLAIGGLAAGVRTATMAAVGQRLLHRVRTDAMAGLFRIPLDDYERSHRGDLQARVSSDVDTLAGSTERLLPEAAGLTIAVVAGVVGVGVLSPVLAALTLVAVPPALVAGAWLRRRSGALYPVLMERHADALGIAVETIEGSETVAAFRAGPTRDRLLVGAHAAFVGASVAAASMRNRFYSSLLVIQAVATALVVGTGAVLAERDSISVGTAAAAILALSSVFAPLSLLVGQLDELLAARVALARVAALALQPASYGGQEALPDRGELRFDGVWFAYPGGEAALRDLDLRVGAGEWVALVGATGAGKSTVARIAVGLTRPTTGMVTLGGVDLQAVTPASRRDRLLLVTQESFLVDGSIADNARLARPELSDAAVDRAVDRLGLRAWIDSLPDGVHTDVGAGGGRLSAGERQLVALLRVVIADPAVVILDEATSVLDPETEAAVAAALVRACVGRTVLVIAHRRATAARCHRIAVLDRGRLVQEGTAAELDRADGAFASLWEHA